MVQHGDRPSSLRHSCCHVRNEVHCPPMHSCRMHLSPAAHICGPNRHRGGCARSTRRIGRSNSLCGTGGRAAWQQSEQDSHSHRWPQWKQGWASAWRHRLRQTPWLQGGTGGGARRSRCVDAGAATACTAAGGVGAKVHRPKCDSAGQPGTCTVQGQVLLAMIAMNELAHRAWGRGRGWARSCCR